jgi:hypothetical protein
MRKLKSYNLFESNTQQSDIELEIQDILIDMIDDGYRIDINFGDLHQYITLFISHKSSKYALVKTDMSKYIDDLIRLKDYMERLGYRWLVGNQGGHLHLLSPQVSFEEKIEEIKNTKLGALFIYFVK